MATGTVKFFNAQKASSSEAAASMCSFISAVERAGMSNLNEGCALFDIKDPRSRRRRSQTV